MMMMMTTEPIIIIMIIIIIHYRRARLRCDARTLLDARDVDEEVHHARAPGARAPSPHALADGRSC